MPGDVLHVRGFGVAIVEALDSKTIALRLDRQQMSLLLPVSEIETRLRPLVSVRRLRALLRTLDQPSGEKVGKSARDYVRTEQLQRLLKNGEPRDWVGLLRSYATAPRLAEPYRYKSDGRAGASEVGAVRELVEALADELAAGDPVRFERECQHIRSQYDAARLLSHRANRARLQRKRPSREHAAEAMHCPRLRSRSSVVRLGSVF